MQQLILAQQSEERLDKKNLLLSIEESKKGLMIVPKFIIYIKEKLGIEINGYELKTILQRHLGFTWRLVRP